MTTDRNTQLSAMVRRSKELAEEVNNGLPWEEAIRELASMGPDVDWPHREALVDMAFVRSLSREGQGWHYCDFEERVLAELAAQTGNSVELER